MKYEKPIVEIQKFGVKDIISSSGDISARTGTFEETNCKGTQEDEWNYDNCV